DRQIQNVGGNGKNQFGQYAGQVTQNQQGYNAWQNGIANQNGTGNVVATRAEGTGNGNQARLSCSLIKRKNQGFNFKQNNLTSGYCRDQTIQTMHMLNPKPNSFYHPAQKMALGVFVPQMTKSKEELFLSNVLNMVTVSKMISIPNEDLSDDTTPSVAQKFLNEVNNSPVTLQRVVKQKMTLEVHNWSSFAHKEVHKIISHEIDPIINQVDAKVQNFEIQFLQEAAKFIQDFKSLAKKADESLDKQKSLELEIERILKASVSHDIMSIVQNGFVDVPSDLQTELNRTK
nr:hypothetical protein [Tanacetum cinerariifolium]